MARIKIPECSNPFEVTVNGRRYKYEAGIETDVPDDVAKAIEKHHKQHKKEPPEAKAPFGAIRFNDLKDKPFYEELEPLVSATITEYYDNSSGKIYSAKTPIELEVVEGESYVVNVDGVSYSCKGMYGNYIGSRHYYIGNGNLHYSDFPGNGDPFVICHCWDDVDGWYYTTWFSDNNPHTITVYKSIIKPLDTKYLPEALQIGEEETILYDGEVDLSQDTYAFSQPLDVIEDKEYCVYLDGVEHRTSTVWDDGEYGVQVTKEGGSMLMTIYRDGVYKTNAISGTHNLKFSQTTIKTIDIKYLSLDEIKAALGL